MKEFIDKNTGLKWLIFDCKSKQFKSQDWELFIGLNHKLNNWQSPNIEEFICGSYPLGDSLRIAVSNNSQIFFNNSCYQAFAFDNEQLVGTAILTTDKPKHVYLEDEISDRLKINYIIVNPNYTNRGIGTRMLKSINDNQKLFCNSVKTKGTVAWVYPTNTASQKTFLKNKFTRFKKMDSPHRIVFYTSNKKTRKNGGMEP